MSPSTPCFVLHKSLLAKNINEFRVEMESCWPKTMLSYSVKTNSLPWLLKYLCNEGIAAEVVSDEEYELALLCGYKDSDIIFNGPCKGHDRFLSAIKAGARVNIDTKREVNWLTKSNMQLYESRNLGIRVNLPPSLFDENDIGYVDDGFRFGFSDETGGLKEALERLKNVCDISHIGFHMHCNSITRSTAVYHAIAKYAAKISEKYGIEPSYVDVGGGFFGGVSNKPTAAEYFETITEELVKSPNLRNSVLIAEPGSALIGSTVDLYTSVIDAKDTGLARIITTDGSRVHIDPLWKKTRYNYTIIASSKEMYENEQIICGYTCMDHDRLMAISSEPKLSTGDRIVYHMVGAYSMTFGGPFIRYWPDVYVEDEGKLERVRSRISVSDYLSFQS